MHERLSLLKVWQSAPHADYIISEIMEQAKKKSKPWVFNSLQSLVKDNLLIYKKRGNLGFYSLNLDNPLLPQAFEQMPGNQGQTFLATIKDIIKNVSQDYCLFEEDGTLILLTENKITFKGCKSASFREFSGKGNIIYNARFYFKNKRA